MLAKHRSCGMGRTENCERVYSRNSPRPMNFYLCFCSECVIPGSFLKVTYSSKASLVAIGSVSMGQPRAHWSCN
jgi:hypothetical protein